MARLDAQTVSLDLSTFDLSEVTDPVQSYLEHANQNKGLEITWNVEPNLPMMTTDALKLEEILQNLLSNAMKFTDEGSIEVAIRDLPEQSRLEFMVRDTGIGIEKEELAKVFQAFYQLKEAHTGSYDGGGSGTQYREELPAPDAGRDPRRKHSRRGNHFLFYLAVLRWSIPTSGGARPPLRFRVGNLDKLV